MLPSTPHLRSLLLLCACSTVGCGDDAASAADTDSGTTGSSTSSSTSSSSGGGETSTGPVATTGEPGGTTGGTTGEPPPPPLEWTDQCITAGYDLTELHPDVLCTGIEVPLDWDDPDGEQIIIAALRVPTDVQPRVGTFWALDGGPGGSGLFYYWDTGWVDEITAAGYDVIVPPHRGTVSPRLQCGSLDHTSVECREWLESEWGDGLQHFNTKWAARDVGELIAREQTDETEPTVVYGVSYGTYWAQFYAGEFPEQADAIILDSAVPTDADLALEEYLVQDVAEQLLQACVEDPACGARVGFGSGAEFAAAVIDAIDNGDCGAGDNGLWEDSNLRFEFGQLINVHRIRNYVPLLAAMLTRCDPELTSIVNSAYFDLINQSLAFRRPFDELPMGPAAGRPAPLPVPLLGNIPPPGELSFSGPLQAAVLSTTMLSPDADPAQAELDAERHIASLGFGGLMANVKEGWGDLPKIDFDRDFVSQTPMLVINASYDLQTVFPWAEAVAEQHMQPLIEFADARHGVTLSGTGGKYPDGSSCARALMLEWMTDPTASIDDTCTTELPQIDVNLQRPDLQELSTTVFATTDPWSLLPPLEG